tara:strand:+ start:1407 stop:1706 length:300 start_codon:yes stop_codon:yes gene_type:complete
MLLLNNKKKNHIITCLELSFGINTYDEIRVFIAKRNKIDKKRILITLVYNSNIVKIKEDQMNEILPIGMLKAQIIIEIVPSEIEKKIAELFNNLDLILF